VSRVAEYGIEVRHAVSLLRSANPLVDLATHRLLLRRMNCERAILRKDRVTKRRDRSHENADFLGVSPRDELAITPNQL